MTKLKNAGVRASAEFLTALDKHLKQIKYEGSRNDYILSAIEEKVARKNVTLPVPKAPHGVRLDARPDGWRSRLYRDRYQLIADYDVPSQMWHFYHQHLGGLQLNHELFGVGRFELPYPCEVAVYCPAEWHDDDVEQAIELELLLPDWETLWDRD